MYLYEGLSSSYFVREANLLFSSDCIIMIKHISLPRWIKLGEQIFIFIFIFFINVDFDFMFVLYSLLCLGDFQNMGHLVGIASEWIMVLCFYYI